MIRTPATAQTNPDPEQTRLEVPPEVLTTTIGGHINQTAVEGVAPTREDALGGPS